ncbi:MAG: cyclase family protein [Gammaproteobacteria bacterium]|nr:cyclase family protein [Gammaproteobacteria bacterium]
MMRTLKSCFFLMFIVCPLSLHAETNKIIDLTYLFNNQTIYWPTQKGFQHQKLFYGVIPAGFFYSAYKFCAPEHGGTHMDAPRHFFDHGWTVDQIPPSQFMGNAVVIHVDTHQKRDYAISVEDIKDFEHQHRALTDQDIVLFDTGWGKYWHNKKQYLGSDKFKDIKHLHFPGISKKAAQYLVDKKIKGVGLDTASLDPGISRDFWAHRIILGANIYGLENVAYLDAMPVTGAKLIVAPMKIEDGSGAPTRLYACLP